MRERAEGVTGKACLKERRVAQPLAENVACAVVIQYALSFPRSLLAVLSDPEGAVRAQTWTTEQWARHQHRQEGWTRHRHPG